MSFIEKLKAYIQGIRKPGIRIHTAPSGSQSIRVIDLLLDEKVAKEMDQLATFAKKEQEERNEEQNALLA